MRPYRILVTGAREVSARDRAYVENVIYLAALSALNAGRQVVIVQGRCPAGGVDRVAEEIAEAGGGLVSEPHPADWDHLGRRAGPVRNGEMVAAGADICLAFPAPRSTGTWDCLTKAGKAGIHTRIFPIGRSDG